MVTSDSIPSWLRREYPFSPQRFRTADGAVMSYLDEGPRCDEAVLMLHGNPTWSYYYRHLVQALAPHQRCIVPDHVGMGLSEKPQHRAYTLESRIRDIEALASSLGLRRVHLVAHDWGGAIGCGFAGRHASLMGKLVLMNTAAFHVDWIPPRIALCRAPLFGPLLVRGLNGFAWPATWMAMHRRSLSSDEKRGYLHPYGSWADRVAVNAFVRDIPMEASHATRKTLDAVEAGLAGLRQCETLIVWGGRDFCFDDRFLARWREKMPHAEVHRHAEAGHYVLDDAREEAVAEISRFLRRP